MAPKKSVASICVGDSVSVPCSAFGETYARGQAKERSMHVSWLNEELRDVGVVEGIENGKFLINFKDGEETQWWERKMLRLESQTGGASSSGSKMPVQQVDSEPESSEDERDVSEEEGGGGRPHGIVLDSSDDDGAGDQNASDTSGWTRDDNCATDERMRWGHYVNGPPVWHPSHELSNDEDSPSWFFQVCLGWFDLDFFAEMAALMQTCGREKGNRWENWRVTLDDVIQWMGVWYYFLAFPQNGERRLYFSGGAPRRFGPRHFLEEWLKRGKNGEKGVRWFENMETSFTLPIDANMDDADPFKPVMRMWDSCRAQFNKVVTPGWLLCLDESMVAWQGRGMPGFMVVPRKPTPFGLEIHTCCCAQSGILVNFEVYEGKVAMEQKEFVGDTTDLGVINKSTALTLRCVKPYFSSG